MHLITLIEHSLGDYQKIADWIHSLPIKNKLGETVKACPRQLSLIDITLDESCVEEFLSYLPAGHGHVDSKKLGLMKKIIQKFSPLQPVDISKMGSNTINNQFPRPTFAYFQILGSLPDNKNKKGMDLL